MDKFKNGDKVVFTKDAQSRSFLEVKDYNKIFTVESLVGKDAICLKESFGIYKFNTAHIIYFRLANSAIIKERLGIK